jgi:transposase
MKRPYRNMSKRDLETTIEGLEKRIAELEAELAKALKNPRTSSKPPSSDIVKPPKSPKAKGKKRNKGAQPGHPRHERPLFSPEEIDDTHDYTLDACPDCSGSLELADKAPRVIQQIEFVEKPVRVDEHRGLAYWCERCQKIHYASFPPAIKRAGLVGVELSVHIAYLKGVCHASFSTIRKYVRDVLGMNISRGQLTKVIQKAGDALEGSYNELLDFLHAEACLNIDETGHKENGERFYTWCFRAPRYTVFKISDSRSSQILFDLLGEEFAGVIGCDYFSAYRKYMKDCDILVQFCLAHLIRDLKYLTTLPDEATKTYGKKLLEHMRRLFRTIHQREEMQGEAFTLALERTRRAIIRYATTNTPETREAQNLAKRFAQHGDAYFQFITTPGMEPTNNLAEQAIRFVVLDRHVTQGTRSEKGRQWSERIWTAMATCATQGRSVYDFLLETVEAHFNNQATPSLLFDSS